MARRTTITDKGVVTRKGNTGGIGLGESQYNTGFGPNRQSITAVTSNGTITKSGCYTFSGALAITSTLPAPSGVPGMWFTLRSLSAHQHVFSGTAMSVGTTNGAVATFEAVVGTSMACMSDGLRYLVLGQSGSVTLSG